MPKLIILGTSSAIPDETHYNTHLAIQSNQRVILIDCPGTPILRLKQSGIDLDDLTDLIVTHFHPDHTNGIPLLLMHLWLLGRQAAFTIHGLEHSIERIEAVMELYEWRRWPDFYPVSFKKIPETELALMLENDELKIFSSPVCHLLPTIGLRIELSNSQKVIAYSSDTEPCSAVLKLASTADILIHEATGEGEGHSSPAQAGQIATQASASKLMLIHYPINRVDQHDLSRLARQTFQGEIVVAEDFMEIEL
jgi:ribonuclease Z